MRLKMEITLAFSRDWESLCIFFVEVIVQWNKLMLIWSPDRILLETIECATVCCGL